jgi:rare lipoprotein A
VFRLLLIIAFLCSLTVAGCGSRKPAPGPSRPPAVGDKVPASQRPYSINGRTYYPISSSHGYQAKGLASWYGRKFHGRKTASGERYDMYALTAAHKTLPLGTQVEVENLSNGRKVRLRINDRGPFVRGRIIDLSYKGAKRLGVVGPGTAPVIVRAVGQPVAPGRAAEPPPAFEMGPFTVQVGAFSLSSNARRLAARLSDRYAPEKASVSSFDDGVRVLYRVRVFSLKTEDRAREMVELLARDGFGAGFVVALD